LADLYLALLHYPIENRAGQVVTTSVTNLDLHDIARSCRTYGVKGYFMVTPLAEQHDMVSRILGHWRTAQSKDFHPKRSDALSLIQVVSTFGDVKREIQKVSGFEPEVVLTDARPAADTVTYPQYRESLEATGRDKPAVLVFGTGWGIAEQFYPEVHVRLEPLYGAERGGYNHLSVRSAVAIILDRLRTS